MAAFPGVAFFAAQVGMVCVVAEFLNVGRIPLRTVVAGENEECVISDSIAIEHGPHTAYQAIDENNEITVLPGSARAQHIVGRKPWPMRRGQGQIQKEGLGSLAVEVPTDKVGGLLKQMRCDIRKIESLHHFALAPKRPAVRHPLGSVIGRRYGHVVFDVDVGSHVEGCRKDIRVIKSIVFGA